MLRIYNSSSTAYVTTYKAIMITYYWKGTRVLETHHAWYKHTWSLVSNRTHERTFQMEYKFNVFFLANYLQPFNSIANVYESCIIQSERRCVNSLIPPHHLITLIGKVDWIKVGWQGEYNYCSNNAWADKYEREQSITVEFPKLGEYLTYMFTRFLFPKDNWNNCHILNHWLEGYIFVKNLLRNAYRENGIIINKKPQIWNKCNRYGRLIDQWCLFPLYSLYYCNIVGFIVIL